MGRSPGGEHGNPLQYSCLANPMDRGAWQAAAHRVTKSRTRLNRLSMETHEVAPIVRNPDSRSHASRCTLQGGAVSSASRMLGLGQTMIAQVSHAWAGDTATDSCHRTRSEGSASLRKWRQGFSCLSQVTSYSRADFSLTLSWLWASEQQGACLTPVWWWCRKSQSHVLNWHVAYWVITVWQALCWTHEAWTKSSWSLLSRCSWPHGRDCVSQVRAPVEGS